MVFAYITKTPCLVFENNSYKVKGLYKWLEKSNFIKIYNENSIENDIDYLLNLKIITCVDLDEKFEEIKNIVM